MKAKIIKKLQEIEQKHNVKIIFAIESGSRSWGFASPDSDYDCRFVYVDKKENYLSVLEKKDFIDFANDAVFDINGWDLKKFIQHIFKSNAVTSEWLSANDVYMRNEELTEKLRQLAVDFFNPVAVTHHYLNIARNKLNEVIESEEEKIKKYFYILRPLANARYTFEYQKMPYMNYFETLSKLSIPEKIKKEIDSLYEQKVKSNESQTIKQNQILIEYFKDEIAFFEESLKQLKFTKNREYEKADTFFREIIEKAWN